MNTEPLVRVVQGNPAIDELAALVAVVAARSARVDEKSSGTQVSAWTRSARPSTTPASWRTSLLPR
ncbi:acyl-CoA carboxylase subunit epsilon [Actinoplanes sp. TBRC 11911]|nr:acyl-CoA carboxylase subunit epsilon [Actinoplanes sp. TBRC 11911]